MSFGQHKIFFIEKQNWSLGWYMSFRAKFKWKNDTLINGQVLPVKFLVQQLTKSSATGTRTPVSCVKGKYDNHLHHGGFMSTDWKCTLINICHCVSWKLFNSWLLRLLFLSGLQWGRSKNGYGSPNANTKKTKASSPDVAVHRIPLFNFNHKT